LEGPILHAYDEDGKSAIYSDQQAAAAAGNTAIDYHERYGHISFQSFSHILEVPYWVKNEKIQCSAYIEGKSTKLRSPPTRPDHRKSYVLGLVHFDL
jgi:hypothetical protein